MRFFNLRRRVILPLIAVGLAVFLIGAYFMNHLEEHEKNDAVLQEAEALQSHIQAMLNAKAEVMAANLYFIAQDKELMAALKADNRRALLALATPVYERLKRENNVTHFYFDDAHRINLLRVHKPERYGDKIKRFTTLGAEKSGKLFSGIELGPLGTFTLRSVLPVFDDGQLIGYIELGQEIDGLIQKAHKMFHVELFMFIDKQYLVRSAWEDGMRMLKRPFDWSMLPSSVLVSESLADAPIAALNTMAGIDTAAGIRIGKDIDMNGRHYWPAIIPMRDAEERPVAKLVMLRDMTGIMAKGRNELLTFTAISATMGLGILILLYFVLGRTERQMNASEAALKDMAEKYSTMVESSSDAIFLLDENGFFDCNLAALQMFGCSSREDLLGKHPSSFSPPIQPDGDGSKALSSDHIATAFDTGSHRFEWLHRRLDGQLFPADVQLTVMEIEGRKVLQATARDISESKKAQQEIKQALNVQQVLDTILTISLPPLTLKEVLGASLEAILSIPSLSLLNQGAIFLVVGDEEKLELVAQRNLPESLLQSCGLLPFGKCLCGRAAADREAIYVSHLDEQHDIRYEGIEPHGHYCLPIMLQDRLLGVLNVYVSTEHASEESEMQALKTVADTLGVVIARKHAQEELDQMAHTDALTDLPNRALFYDRLDQALALAQRHRHKFSVLFIDLDHFKDINDTLGHGMGDALLKEAADRLTACVRKVDTVARMGGDEFTVILTETKVAQDVVLVAKKIIQSLTQPFELGGRRCKVGCSIGIAMYPDHGRDSDTLLRHADASMYNAKRLRNTYCFFSEGPLTD